MLAQCPKLCKGVTLNRRDSEWYATFVIGQKDLKIKSSRIDSMDLGMVAVLIFSEGQRTGKVGAILQQWVVGSTAKHRCQQQPSTCLKCKSIQYVGQSDTIVEPFVSNEISWASNQILSDLSNRASVALECRSAQDRRMKSRQMNRTLQVCRLNDARNEFKLGECDTRYTFVQLAYSSQQRLNIGFMFSLIRRPQAKFCSSRYGLEVNAEENIAQNSSVDFGESELNAFPFRDLEPVMAIRFIHRHSP